MSRWLLSVLGLGCNEVPPAGVRPLDSVAVAETLVPLPGPRLLRRLSLDLTGRLPSVAALDDAEAESEAWRTWREIWLSDPRFEEHLVHLLGERWLTRVDEFDVDHTDFGLPDSAEYTYERDIGEEPLRLIARIASTDAAWSEVVTASYTVATPQLASMWPLSCPEGEGWQECVYTDGRPVAGVLSTNGLWWRYTTTPTNLNRGRVAAMVKLLVCEDILLRRVSFADVPSLLDVDAAADAIRNEPACQACHAEVDPAGAALMGFYWTVMYSRVEHSVYHPEREYLAESLLGVSPAWYGTPVSGLGELGEAIAADPRFNPCAVRSFAELYWRRPAVEADEERLAALAEGWDGRVKSLIRQISESPEYQAGDRTDPATEAALVRMMSPIQLADTIEELTGFRWTWEGVDRLDEDQSGYRLLAGGVDGDSSVIAQRDPGLTWALVVKRLAEAAAANVVAVDLVAGQQQRLLREVSLGDLPGTPAFESQLRSLAWQLYAERIDAEEVGELSAQWSTFYAVSDPATAWTALLSVMLRDTRMVSY